MPWLSCGKTQFTVQLHHPAQIVSQVDESDYRLISSVATGSGEEAAHGVRHEAKDMFDAGAPASALPHLRVVDLDATDRPYRVLPDEDNSPLTAVAVHDGKLWVAATTAPGVPTIYAFAAGDLTRPVETADVPEVIRFEARSAALLAACADGALWAIGGSVEGDL